MTVYYQDDHVTLHLGDCRDITDWLSADVLVTDPPYGRDWRQGELKGHHSPSRDGIANDRDTSVRDAALALWGTQRAAIMFGDLMLAPPAGTKLTGIYKKPNNAGLRGAIGRFRRDAEAIYLIGPGFGSGIGGDSSILTTGIAGTGGGTQLGGRSGHPHEKPLDVLEILIDRCPPGVVADPFAGSGSTLVAAKAMGRRAIGVEIAEKYAEVAARRLAQDVLDFGVGA